MGRYDTYPVRNSSGYIEYLTAEEIENLREMGELGDVLSDRPSSKHPPIAKNPANQAFINEQWAKAQLEKRDKRRRSRKKFVEGAVTAVTAFSGMTAEPPIRILTMLRMRTTSLVVVVSIIATNISMNRHALRTIKRVGLASDDK